MVCIISCFTTPDGDTIFYKLLGLFGIGTVVRLENNTILYIYILIPLIAGIICIRKVFKHWKAYTSRFKAYSILLRILPTLIIILVLSVSNIMSPSVIDHIYYTLATKNKPLSVTYYATNNISYKFTGNNRTYSYDFTFGNPNNETVDFSVKFSYQDHENNDTWQEVLVKDTDGQVKVFTLSAKQSTRYNGEFTEYFQTNSINGGGDGLFSIVLLNDNEQLNPIPIVRHPILLK